MSNESRKTETKKETKGNARNQNWKVKRKENEKNGTEYVRTKGQLQKTCE